jgi:chromate transporter
LLATLGIFLPSFLFVGLLSRVLPYVRKSPWAAVFLDGVNAASLGLMAGVTVNLGQTAIKDIFTIMLLLGTLLASFRLGRVKICSQFRCHRSSLQLAA